MKTRNNLISSEFQIKAERKFSCKNRYAVKRKNRFELICKIIVFETKILLGRCSKLR